MKNYDVVVVGAGPGGLTAAIVAGKAGLKTAIVERNAFVAGTINTGLCVHGFEDGNGRRVIGGKSWELISRCVAAGGSVGPTRLIGSHMYSTTPVDMAILQTCAVDMLEEAGVDLWLHTLMTEPVVDHDRLLAVRAWGNSGEFEFRARTFIDATGHADLAYRAGVPTRDGRVGDGAMQPMSLGLTMAPVDLDRMMAAIGAGYGKARKPHTDKEDFVWFTLVFKHWEKELEEIGLRFGKAGACWGNSIYPGIVNLNAVKVIGKDGADTVQLSQAEVQARRTAVLFTRFLRERIPGFEDAHMVRVAPFIGIRETRHIEGLYEISSDDAVQGRIPEDSIALCGYPVDIHDPKDGVAEFQQIANGRFGIPYRTLVPKNIRNLLVSGRGISASDVAFGSLRVMGQCLAFGEACGTATVLAQHEDVDVSELDGRRVREILEREGAMIM
ncbi:MAG: FAD-dependent oxidoreductase [Burkholderiaceae bacterium]|nr:FAD-dependent oxidoreductase [Burkholderiaceae bacterium]